MSAIPPNCLSNRAHTYTVFSPLRLYAITNKSLTLPIIVLLLGLVFSTVNMVSSATSHQPIGSGKLTIRVYDSITLRRLTFMLCRTLVRGVPNVRL